MTAKSSMRVTSHSAKVLIQYYNSVRHISDIRQTNIQHNDKNLMQVQRLKSSQKMNK